MDQSRAPDDIVLSVLTWHGRPTTGLVDGSGGTTIYVGEYREANRSTWHLAGRNDANTAHLYKPVDPQNATFSYNKQAFTGTVSTDVMELGGILAAEMPPLVRFGLPDVNLWPELGNQLDPDSGEFIEMEIPGPPFRFYECDFPSAWDTPNTFFFARDTLRLYVDLPGQPDTKGGQADMVPGLKKDSWIGVGWHGPWADELIALANNNQPLGEITQTVASANKSWTMDLHLVATSIQLLEWDKLDVEDERSQKSISRLDVQATVSEVCVQPGLRLGAHVVEGIY